MLPLNNRFILDSLCRLIRLKLGNVFPVPKSLFDLVKVLIELLKRELLLHAPHKLVHPNVAPHPLPPRISDDTELALKRRLPERPHRNLVYLTARRQAHTVRMLHQKRGFRIGGVSQDTLDLTTQPATIRAGKPLRLPILDPINDGPRCCTRLVIHQNRLIHLPDSPVLQRCRRNTSRSIPRHSVDLGTTNLALPRLIGIKVVLRCNTVLLKMARLHETATRLLRQTPRTPPRHPLQQRHLHLRSPHLGAPRQRNLTKRIPQNRRSLSRIRLSLQRQEIILLIAQRLHRIRQILIPRTLPVYLSSTRKRVIRRSLQQVEIGVLRQSIVHLNKVKKILVGNLRARTPHNRSVLSLTHLVHGAPLHTTRIPLPVTGMSRNDIPPRIIRLLHSPQTMIRVEL